MTESKTKATSRLIYPGQCADFYDEVLIALCSGNTVVMRLEGSDHLRSVGRVRILKDNSCLYSRDTSRDFVTSCFARSTTTVKSLISKMRHFDKRNRLVVSGIEVISE